MATKTGMDEYCVCDVGFTGPDCSERICPSGRAWVDYPTGNTTAHAKFFECSNMGYCDRLTGECVCRDGFDGEACHRLRCPVSATDYGVRECSGHGRCLSMGEAARERDFVTLFYENEYRGWDSEMIFGCACDDGWDGYDCSRRHCPKGDDPLTAGVDEIQLIDCRCDSDCTSSNATLTVTFQGQTTEPIPFTATPELVEMYLEALTSITDVDVRYVGGARDSSLCDNLGTTAVVTFLQSTNFNDDHPNYVVPAMNATVNTNFQRSLVFLQVQTNGDSSALRPGIISSQRGTREAVVCSNHGTCDFDQGLCRCYRGFGNSDGRGNQGIIGDCGYKTENATVNIKFYNPNSTDSPCPVAVPLWNSGADPAVCSGAGNCVLDRTCNCTAGYTGPACEFLECPSAGFAWFAETTNDGYNPHRSSSSECSNRGLCNRQTGTCTCDERYSLFEGDSCEELACYVNITETCSGHGRCATLAEFAQETFLLGPAGDRIYTNYSDPWDATALKGCLCDRSEGIFDWNTSSTSYRGFFAMAYTDWTGYTCARAFCPTGDNPFTWGVNEIQRINCTATQGGFNVTFRDAQPPARIPWWATEEKIQGELEKLATLRNVDVSFVHFAAGNHSFRNTTACADGQFIDIEFRSERGDLPLLFIDPTDLAGTVNISEVQKGTKEDVECSAAGICNRDHGQCGCLDGHYSGSDVVPFRDLGAVGQRGDCSFRHTSTDKDEFYNLLFEYSYVYGSTIDPFGPGEGDDESE